MNTEKINIFIENKLSPIMAKISSNRYINAVNAGFGAVSPLILIGSFFIIIFNLPLANENSFLYIKAYHNFVTSFYKYYIQIFNASIGIISLFLSYSIAYSLAGHYKLDSQTNAFLSVYSFVLLSAKSLLITISSSASNILYLKESSTINVIDASYLNAKGVLIAILCSIISVEVYRFIIEKKINIKFPQSVPPAIAKSIEPIIPFIVMSVVCQAANIITEHYINNSVSNIIFNFMKYFYNFADSLILIILILLLVHILWFCGSIHGSNVASSIINPIVLINLTINQNALINGENLTRIFAGEFMNSFVYLGGAGATLGLCISMLMSKNEELKSIGKMSIVPALFNINEPILFGTPIIMNNTFFIPFIITPIVNASITYCLFKFEFLSKIIAAVPWTTPSILGSFISTNFCIKAPLLIIGLIIIDYLIYKPFFIIHKKKIESKN